MTIQLALKNAVDLLKIIEPSDASVRWMEAEILLAFVLKKDRAWIVSHERELTKKEQKTFDGLIGRRLTHEPIAYLIGEREFLGHRFFVDKRVLIPRPETEEMVERAIKMIGQKKGTWTVADIGTGSGAIAISIKKTFPSATVIASDISTDALSAAKKNAQRLHADVIFIKADVLDGTLAKKIARTPSDKIFVLANLPYLPDEDRRTLDPDVVNFEPSSALFVEADGTKLITRLLEQLAQFQKTDGRELAVCLEYDPSQTATLMARAKRLFPTAIIKYEKDNRCLDRFLLIKTTPRSKSGR